MSDHIFVTTFSRRGYELYGERFVQQFLKHLDVPLHVFSEDLPWRNTYSERLSYWSFDQQHDDFCEKYKGPEYNHRTDYAEQSVRFCHKVFAITSDELPKSRWRIWIDADVELFRDVNEDDLKDICPEDCCLSFLGRTGLMRPGQKLHTECGFVAYKYADPRVRNMLFEMRRVYTSGKLFSLGRHNWHDSYVFDFCRERSGIPVQEQHNLSAGVQGLDVWDKTVLSKFSRHNKGLRAKVKAYGGRA